MDRPSERDHQRAIEELRRLIDEGLASGVSDQTIDDIWREVEERHAKKNGRDTPSPVMPNSVEPA